MNIFEQASRNKLRISYKGSISVEDLWDLELTELDSIYKFYNKIVNDSGESLLSNNTVDKNAVLSVEIIKYIVKDKLEERENRRILAEKAALKEKITDALADKQEDALRKMTEEELLAQLAEL